MRFTTFIGLIGGFLLIIVIISAGGMQKYFLNPIAFLITFGGTFFAMIVYHSPKSLLSTLRVLTSLFFSEQVYPRYYAETLIDMARESRKVGFIPLTKKQEIKKHKFLHSALLLLADGSSEDEIRESLSEATELKTDDFVIAERLLRTAGSLAPMFGMLGTVTGLIMMLHRMSTPEAIPKAMGIALVSTFYGLILSGLVLKPLAGKIRDKGAFEKENNNTITEGVVLIKKGENLQIMREKLNL